MHEALTQRASGSFHHAQGWGLSLLIHGLALGVTVLMLGDLTLTPKPEPFKWNVAMVEPPPRQVAQPADAQPKPAQPAKQAPAPKPVERQTTIVQAVPTPQPTPTPVVQRQEPVPPVVERKPEPELKPEIKPEAPSPMPMVAKPVEPLVQHPTHHISTQPAVSHASSEPATMIASAPMVASVASSAPVEAAPPAPAHQAAQESAKEQPAESSSAPVQEAAVHHAPAPSGTGRATKADYGWLGKVLWDRVANLKRYPHLARAKHLEGRVVVRAVIREDGHLAKVDVAESSGHEILDLDAIEIIKRACPLHLRQPLGRPEVVVQVPISYKLQ
ncbi:MAG: TonB family protein [Nitrospirae bacterium]|nr:MAG: TonB family protein [Nitrospirota bacterium]